MARTSRWRPPAAVPTRGRRPNNRFVYRQTTLVGRADTSGTPGVRGPMRMLIATAAFGLLASALHADTLKCNLVDYKPAPGLRASIAGDALTLTWDGDRNQEVRLRFVVEDGTPKISEL